MAKKKTISGAMNSIPNLEHNLREHIPPNSVGERRNRNLVYTSDSNVELRQVYEKLFADSYAVWRDAEIKKGRGGRFPETYYEKIDRDKQKKLVYEVIWQIGDMMDTGFLAKPEEADKAEKLLDEFADYLLHLPEICVVTDKELGNPDWKPPFEAGLIVHHMVYHGDENSPHIHMTYIPYTTHSKKGAPIQNALAQMFEDIGFPTAMKQAVDKEGQPVWQKDKNGNLKPQMKRDKHGGVDWVEKQKKVLQELMAERFGWERLYKGSNPRGNMLLSDYRREKAEERARKAEMDLDLIMGKVASNKETIENQTENIKLLQDTLQKGMSTEYELSTRIRRYHDEMDMLDDVKEAKSNEIEVQKSKLAIIKAETEDAIEKSNEAEKLVDYFESFPESEREHEYFEKALALTCENKKLMEENTSLKAENHSLRERLNQAYDFMKQFTIGRVNMLEKFLRSIGEWMQQKVAGLGR